MGDSELVFPSGPVRPAESEEIARSRAFQELAHQQRIHSLGFQGLSGETLLRPSSPTTEEQRREDNE